jgi:glycine/D-amino acid oxidase-like deaminating enzyme
VYGPPRGCLADATVLALQQRLRRWAPTSASRRVLHDFILERQGPIVVGSPCSGHGFKFTPLVGRILADPATEVGRRGGCG